jgi:hypothetical protein
MPSTAYRLVPWTDVAQPNQDVAGGALDMGTYAVNLARVFRRRPGVPDVYGRPDRFFAATYFTEKLRELLTDVLEVLAGGPGDQVLQLRTPFGGGKTHTLVALLHLARDRDAAAGIAELAGLADPGRVRVAVLSGEELDPLDPFRSDDGQETHTLWGELAAQLGSYDLVAEHDRTGVAPGGDLLHRVLGEGPVLLLLDEVLVYVEKAMAVVRGDSTLGRQAMLFVQALTEVVNTRPCTAMVYSLQASVGEAVGAEGLLSQLDHLVSRIDAKREPVSGDEVMRVVQRRLFADPGDPAVRREVATAYADLIERQLQAQAETDEGRREAAVEARRLEERILASYPFHPALLDLMYHRWGTLPSYQRTRGALQFLASVIHGLWQRGSDSALIGPGEVDLSYEPARGAFFSQVGERERYTAVLDGDVVADGSGAAVVDRRIGADAPALAQLRVGTRMATAIMLYSFGTREGEEKGVLESDLVTVTLVPGLDRNVVVAALHDLREEELFLHYTGRRYRFEPVPNLTKLVRDEANKFLALEVLERVRAALEEELGDARNALVWPDSPEKVRDKVPAFTLAYLHPDWSQGEQPLTRFVEGTPGRSRDYRNAVGFVLPDGAQFDRARASARLLLAAESLLKRRAQLGFSPEQVAELKEKLEGAERDLGATLARAYGRAVVPVRASSGSGPYRLDEVDLRSLLAAGRSLDQRVRAALEHRVFDHLTVDKLVALAGLGPDRPVVRCADLVDWFFSYFEFTKLWSTAAIADAIFRGVGDGRFAYATGLEVVYGTAKVRDPKLVRFRELLPVGEIDLSGDAAILTAELAESLVAPPPVAGDAGPPEPDGDGSQPGGDLFTPPAPPPRPVGPTDRITTLALRVRLEGRALYGLTRALSWLREHSSTMDIELTVRVLARDEGFLRSQLTNGVIEPLEEGGVDDTDIHLELS